MNEKQLEQARYLAARSYKILVSQDELSDRTGVFVAYNPELKGCKSYGATPDEAMHNLVEARVDFIYYLLEDELYVPSPHNQISVTGIPGMIEAYSTIEITYSGSNKETTVYDNARNEDSEFSNLNNILEV